MNGHRQPTGVNLILRPDSHATPRYALLHQRRCHDLLRRFVTINRQVLHFFFFFSLVWFRAMRRHESIRTSCRNFYSVQYILFIMRGYVKYIFCNFINIERD